MKKFFIKIDFNKQLDSKNQIESKKENIKNILKERFIEWSTSSTR